jgi:hypothetical protein
MPITIFSMLIIRLIKLYSLVLDYLHAQKNSNVRIKDQHGSFSVHIGKGVFGCFADLEMMFVMYQKANSWKLILRYTIQIFNRKLVIFFSLHA